jgi:hypothetical protein
MSKSAINIPVNKIPESNCLFFVLIMKNFVWLVMCFLVDRLENFVQKNRKIMMISINRPVNFLAVVLS